MGTITPELVKKVLARPGYEGISVFVETGTHRGLSTSAAYKSGMFREIITIELSRDLHARALKKFRNTGIICLNGSSAALLEGVSEKTRHPAFFFLDAHWFSRQFGADPSVSKDDPFPLWRELEILKARPYADVISIDDVHAFGATRPDLDPKWKEVSGEKIVQTLGESRVDHTLQISDQFVVYMKKL